MIHANLPPKKEGGGGSASPLEVFGFGIRGFTRRIHTAHKSGSTSSGLYGIPKVKTP